MKINNVIELRAYRSPGEGCPGCRRGDCPPARLQRLREGMRLVISVLEALTTAAIGVCCLACLVLVYTML